MFFGKLFFAVASFLNNSLLLAGSALSGSLKLQGLITQLRLPGQILQDWSETAMLQVGIGAVTPREPIFLGLS
jgi:hypothetical protein